jgi:hypothetical protein
LTEPIGYIAAAGPGNVPDYTRPVWSCGHEHATRGEAIECLAAKIPPVEQEVPRNQAQQSAEQWLRSIRWRLTLARQALEAAGRDCDNLDAAMGKAEWPKNDASS